MPDDKPAAVDLMKGKLLPAAAGLIVLLVAGVAGGKIAGFKIEPEQCSECGLALASCNTRVELMTTSQEDSKTGQAEDKKEAKEREEALSKALDAAKLALISAYQECQK